MKVSICTITYNHARYIAQSLESALMQVGVEFEIVVGDDCSTDGTRKILEEYQRRYPNTIRLLPRKQNLGMLRNFVDSLKACTGQYVALLEGDDYWTDPQKLLKQITFLDRNPGFSACCHLVAELEEDQDKPGAIYPPLGQRRSTYTLENLLVINPMHTCSVVYRNGIVKSFPDWFFRLRLGDWTMHLLNAVHGPIGALPEVMAVYRRHSGGVWSTQSEIRRAEGIMMMLGYFDLHTAGRYRRAVRRSFSRLYYHLADVCFQQGDVVNGRAYAMRRLTLHPLNGDLSDRHVPMTIFMVSSPMLYRRLKEMRNRLPDQLTT